MVVTEKANKLVIGVFGQQSNVVTTTVKIVDVLLFLRSNLLIHLIQAKEAVAQKSEIDRLNKERRKE